MRRVLFIHHSTGGNLLNQGEIRNRLYSATSDVELWDHGYNLYPILGKLIGNYLPTFHTGLSNAQGEIVGKDYQLDISNKDVGSYLNIFDESHPFLNEILKFDVVIFKMCYPSTKIESEQQLLEAEEKYAEVRTKLERFGDNQFGLFTPPPLRYELTTPESAKRVVELQKWMLSNMPSRNLRLFDFFGEMAELNSSSQYFGTLKRNYCRLISKDSHPNKRANVQVADKFVNFILTFTI